MTVSLYLDDNGVYLWAAYAITFAVIIWNIWSAHACLRRNLRQAKSSVNADDAARQPRVRQL